ncbi:hypothetical protein SCH4B_0560 [Ruegeria sp. TrichCH4B]|nr:hypothetical protein SCH4B_0560 [Ruegeria sp. TrichCH4B]
MLAPASGLSQRNKVNPAEVCSSQSVASRDVIFGIHDTL